MKFAEEHASSAETGTRERNAYSAFPFASLRRNVNAEMTVTLYKSTDKRNWDYVTSWDTSGSSILSLEKSYYVMSGYYYQAELSADVYNSSGSFLENVTSNSSIQYY